MKMWKHPAKVQTLKCETTGKQVETCRNDR